MSKKLSWIVTVASTASMLMGCAVSDQETGDEDIAETSDAIIGGSVDNAHPYVVAISYVETDAVGREGGRLCSGTLIGPRSILTAAHCVLAGSPGGKASSWKVFFGTDATQPGTWYPTTSAVAHPSYNRPNVHDNDVAIIKLAADAPVKPIRVGQVLSDQMVGKSIIHAGFGVTSSLNGNKTGSGVKHTTTLPVSQATRMTLRTGNGKSGVCHGDSGGAALSINATTKETFVVGVHSYVSDATQCAGYGFSIRTDVVYPFIKQNL